MYICMSIHGHESTYKVIQFGVSTCTHRFLTQPFPGMIAFVLQGGWSPLIAASARGHVEVVRSLIEAGANFNHTNKVGICTVLLYSIRCTPFIAIVLCTCMSCW